MSYHKSNKERTIGIPELEGAAFTFFDATVYGNNYEWIIIVPRHFLRMYERSHDSSKWQTYPCLHWVCLTMCSGYRWRSLFIVIIKRKATTIGRTYYSFPGNCRKIIIMSTKRIQTNDPWWISCPHSVTVVVLSAVEDLVLSVVGLSDGRVGELVCCRSWFTFQQLL